MGSALASRVQASQSLSTIRPSPRGIGELGLDELHRARAVTRDPELTRFLHDDARVRTRDVAQGHVALGLAREAREVHHVRDGWGGRQQLKRFTRLVARGDYAKVDNA